MLRNVALAAGLFVALVAPAYADCAGDIEKVTQAASAAQLSDADKAAVNDALTAAKEKAGDEAACQAALAPAKKILNIE